ncbi:MAG TPA: arginine deiminase family protein, partial [Spirochaetales bacterium]|nr:arginine deiminase family protein [Spirochaetales bacterium]
MDRRLRILSETGRLRRVIVHTPGAEIEAMRPSRAEEELYNDIIPLEVVKREHSQLKGFLAKVAEVSELGDLLVDALGSADKRERFAAMLADHYGAAHRLAELEAMDAGSLAKASIGGLPVRHVRLASYVRGAEFDIPPLPNMYFMRDAAMVYKDKSISSAMRFPVRRAESLINRFVFENHPDFKGGGRLIDGPAMVGDGFSIEGGDFQVVRGDVVVIGVSERTSARAIDAVAEAIVGSYGEPVTLFAVLLPVARATIHLDMA